LLQGISKTQDLKMPGQLFWIKIRDHGMVSKLQRSVTPPYYSWLWTSSDLINWTRFCQIFQIWNQRSRPSLCHQSLASMTWIGNSWRMCCMV
jgi:hypothetical protein